MIGMKRGTQTQLCLLPDHLKRKAIVGIQPRNVHMRPLETLDHKVEAGALGVTLPWNPSG